MQRDFHNGLTYGKDAVKPKIKLFCYDKDSYEERDVESIESLKECKDNERVVWIDLQGNYRKEDVEYLGRIFGLHPSAVKSALTPKQRPTYEEFEDHIFIIASQAYIDGKRVMREQISIFLKKGLLITLQERPGDVFEPVRKKIREDLGKIRSKGADFLAYSILREILDHYFEVEEYIGRIIDNIEEKVLEKADKNIMKELHAIKTEILFLKHIAWPMRGVMDEMYRDETGIITKDTKRYLRSVQDMALQIIELSETYRDMVSSMTDIYLSSLSYRTNEIMKILTIIATIFIPLTFVTGLYGMNFNTRTSPYNMPELNWYWGYPATLAGMLIISVVMLLYFRKKGWI